MKNKLLIAILEAARKGVSVSFKLEQGDFLSIRCTRRQDPFTLKQHDNIISTMMIKESPAPDVLIAESINSCVDKMLFK